MTRVVFEKVTTGKVTRVWRENGRRRQETKEFWQTVNPFNKNAEGLPKTRLEIMGELHAERAVWLHEKELAAGNTEGQR
jgi:hypothetical protein